MADYPNIPDLPPPPLRNDPEDVFAEKASAFVGAMNPWGQSVNVAGNWIEVAAEEAIQARGEAVIARDESVGASQESVSAANAAIAVVDASLWVSGQPYDQGEAAISLVDFQTYRRKIPGSGTTDPADDETNWAQITGVQALPAMGGKAGHALIVDTTEISAEWSDFPLGTNAQGNKTIGTGDPIGGNDGDIHYKVEE